MIRTDDLTAIGSVLKTHGVSGELNIELFRPDRFLPEKGSCLIFDIEGINVPFFVREMRPRGNAGALIMLEDISSDTEAAQLVGKEIFVENKYIAEKDEDDDFLTYDDLVGYTVLDTDGSTVGVINDYDDSTANVLFRLTAPDGSELLIPAAPELVEDVDTEAHTITINLPSGIY